MAHIFWWVRYGRSDTHPESVVSAAPAAQQSLEWWYPPIVPEKIPTSRRLQSFENVLQHNARFLFGLRIFPKCIRLGQTGKRVFLGFLQTWEGNGVVVWFSCFRTDFRHAVGRNTQYPRENLIAQSNAAIGTPKSKKTWFVRFANSGRATRVRVGWHGYLCPTVRPLELHVEWVIMVMQRPSAALRGTEYFQWMTLNVRSTSLSASPPYTRPLPYMTNCRVSDPRIAKRSPPVDSNYCPTKASFSFPNK
jgi:hypothetical protein